MHVRHDYRTALCRPPDDQTVLYPGLETHSDHALAARKMQGGFGGMLSLRFRHGDVAAIACAANLKVWKRAISLGGVESLVEHRSSIEGQGSPCPPDLLRLSVGLESVDDLIEDLEAALTQCSRVASNGHIPQKLDAGALPQPVCQLGVHVLPKTAFVFAGGGSFGAVQVGMLHALMAHWVKADFVVDSSVGAINGAYFAGDLTIGGVAKLEEL